MKKIILFLISLFFSLKSLANKYIIPIILFLQEIKRISQNKTKPITEKNYRNRFFIVLEKWQEYLESIINAFVEAVNTLLAEQVASIPTGPDNILHKFLIIKMYIEHLKTLDNKHRNMLLIKTASLMLINLLFALGKAPITESKADAYCQASYCYMKRNKMLT